MRGFFRSSDRNLQEETEKTEPAFTQKFNSTTDFPADFADDRGFRNIQSAFIRVISGKVLSSVASVSSCKTQSRFGCGTPRWDKKDLP